MIVTEQLVRKNKINKNYFIIFIYFISNNLNRGLAGEGDR